MKVKEIENVITIEPGAPEPLALTNDDKALVCFYGNVENGSEKVDQDILTTVVIEFNNCVKLSFGLPGDETLNGHPYYKLGLRSYGFYELQESDLIDELIKIESVHPYFNKSKWKEYKHYIITFHDNMLECIAKGFGLKEKSAVTSLLEMFLKR